MKRVISALNLKKKTPPACCTFRSGEGRAGGVTGTKWELLVGFFLQPRARAAQCGLGGQAGHAAWSWGSCSASLLWGSLRGYRKGKVLLNVYKVCVHPSKATCFSAISIACARLYSCFKCFEKTLLFLLQWRYHLVVPLLGSWS